MTTPSTNERTMIALMARNLEMRSEEHWANLAEELADLRAMTAQAEAALSGRSSLPMGLVGRIRASALDLERCAIELKAELEALDCARRAHRALDAAPSGADR